MRSQMSPRSVFCYCNYYCLLIVYHYMRYLITTECKTTADRNLLRHCRKWLQVCNVSLQPHGASEP